MCTSWLSGYGYISFIIALLGGTFSISSRSRSSQSLVSLPVVARPKQDISLHSGLSLILTLSSPRLLSHRSADPEVPRFIYVMSNFFVIFVLGHAMATLKETESHLIAGCKLNSTLFTALFGVFGNFCPPNGVRILFCFAESA